MPIDMSNAVAPPRKSTKPRTARTTAPVLASVTQQRYEGLNELSQIGIGLCLVVGQFADAGAIAQHFPPLAHQIAQFADQNETVASMVDWTVKLGPYVGMIAAGMPLALQIMANHKMVDPVRMRMLGQNVMPPEVLEAQMAAQVAQLQAEAQAAKQKAMEDISEARRMMSEMSSPNGAAEPAHAAG